MSAHLRRPFSAAAFVLVSASLSGFALAQNNPPPQNKPSSLEIQPGTPQQHTLGQNPNASNIINETTPSSSNLLTVPLVNIIPGGVNLPKLESPVANDPAAAQRGMQYFVGFNCVGCHAANGGGGIGPSLSNSFFKFGSDPAQMYNVISHGMPIGMPAWGSILPDSAIWDIIAYIGSISKTPSGSWGTTFNIAEHIPAIEQVPAEFMSTTTPWQHTEPFSMGQKPTQHKPTAVGAAPGPSYTPK